MFDIKEAQARTEACTDLRAQTERLRRLAEACRCFGFKDLQSQLSGIVTHLEGVDRLLNGFRK